MEHEYGEIAAGLMELGRVGLASSGEVTGRASEVYEKIIRRTDRNSFDNICRES